MFERMIEELKGVSVEGLSRPELESVTVDVARVRGALDALEVSVAVAVDGLRDGGVGADSVMRRKGGVSRREATRRKQRAGRLEHMPNTAKLLADGEITAEHVDSLVRAAAETADELVDSDEMLLSRAAAQPADRAGRDIRDWVDRHQTGADRADRHARQRNRRAVRWFRGDDDTAVMLCRTDDVTAEQLRARVEGRANDLHRLDRRRQEADGSVPRAWGQLRHDALMIEIGVDSRPGGTGGPASAETTSNAGRMGSGVRNQIVVVADAAALTGDESATVELTGVGPVPLTVLERLGCDAEVFGHIFGVDGVSLWHGRAIRTTTPQQWRTLVARDRGCVLCAAAPAYCEAHHIEPWSLGGSTDVENLVLLCTRHHHELHDANQVLRRTESGWSAVPARAGPSRVGPRPAGAAAGPQPAGPPPIGPSPAGPPPI